jgi:deoxyribodipyrimidine photo-lyase
MMPPPILYWMRRDFRLADNPALHAAAGTGQPVIPVFVLDEVVEQHLAAPKWRLGLAAQTFASSLAAQGSRLILRRGTALDVLRQLAAETGANAVYWNRLYDPQSKARDEGVKVGLRLDGLTAISHAGHVLHEPWTVQTGTGGFYRVYTPFWKTVRDRPIAPVLPVPALRPPVVWPDSAALDDWQMGRAMNRGGAVVQPYLILGEVAAATRLDTFIEERIAHYKEARDQLPVDGTSKLSEPLSYGEISPRQCWHAGWRAMQAGMPGAETFLKEVIWRDFAYHLVFHTPHITTQNWRPEWDAFPWRGDNDQAEDWRRGRTGLPVIDAAMRELYVTGRMHNRARMLVASYLTKHLMTHWRVGQVWFEQCLVDWDPASNAMGWQWSAGSGPDATPYFRVFNPATQAQKFDPAGVYQRRWLAEISASPGAEALSFFDAAPKAWKMNPKVNYPATPIVSLENGRERALAAYKARKF